MDRLGANIVEVGDLSAPELNPYARLTEAQLRKCEGLFIAESSKVISAALDAGCEAVSLLMERRQIEGSGREIIARCPRIPVYTAAREVLETLTGYALTRGVLCAMRRPAPADAATICAGARRVAVVEDVTDSTNVGAIFRSAAALGADALLLTPACCDPLCRRALRVSMGSAFRIPWARIGDWPERGVEALHRWGFQIAAMALDDRAMDVDDARLAGVEKLAILLGTEGDGLSPATVARADYTVRIPMFNGVNSLNVAAASAVAFWQLCGRGKAR